LDALALTGNIRATAREAGVPKSTVHKWSNHYGEEIARRRQEMLGGQHEARVKDVIEWTPKIGQEMRRILEDLLVQVQAKMGDKKVSLYALVYAFSKIFEKHELIEGKPTERKEISVLEKVMQMMVEDE